MIQTLQIGRKLVPTHATFNNWFAHIGQQVCIPLGCVLIAFVAATKCQCHEGSEYPLEGDTPQKEHETRQPDWK